MGEGGRMNVLEKILGEIEEATYQEDATVMNINV